MDTECTPLVALESRSRNAIENHYYAFLVREGILGCCRTNWFRYNNISILVATTILLATSLVCSMGISYEAYTPPTVSSLVTTTQSFENAAKIAQLRESLGASLENLKHAAVASDNKVCSNVGTSILQKGGNAMDAGVATSLCLGVASPASSGLGGGAFVVVRSSRSEFDKRKRRQQQQQQQRQQQQYYRLGCYHR